LFSSLKVLLEEPELLPLLPLGRKKIVVMVLNCQLKFHFSPGNR